MTPMLRRTAMTLASAAAVLLVLPLPAAAGWRPVGPYGGTVFGLAVDPSNPATVLAATYYDGIFHSADRGATWERSGPTAARTFQIAFDPRHSGTAYAGTGNAIYKTTNGGRTWTFAASSLPTGEEFAAFGLAVDPRRTSIVYAATSAGLYKSVDAAAHCFPSLRPSLFPSAFSRSDQVIHIAVASRRFRATRVLYSSGLTTVIPKS